MSLRQYTGKTHYGADEQAWLDRWEELGGTIYSGKECGGSATEILTKGIERLHQDPLLFLLTDPEYFEFVTRTLKDGLMIRAGSIRSDRTGEGSTAV